MNFLHLRNLPHVFHRKLLPEPSSGQNNQLDKGSKRALLCLLDPLQWETELPILLALASKAPASLQNWVWKILLLPQSAEVLQKACRLLDAAPHPLPPLELQVQPLWQWPAFFAETQACLCLSADPELQLRQVVMALAMELPVWRWHSAQPSSLNPFWAELPVSDLPATDSDWHALEVTLNESKAGQPLREKLLKTLQIRQTLSCTALLETEVAIIVYWGRSGSVFLQSLLDHHPQILSTPATVLMRFYEFWTEFLRALVEKNYPFDLNDFLNMFCLYFSSLFYAQPDSSTCCLDQLGPEQNTVLQVDAGAFKESFVWLIQTFFSGGEINSQIFFIALHYAYEMAQGLDISEKHLIAYQLHRPSLNPSTTGLFQDFPQARVLGMAREPIRAFFSHLRMCRDDRRVGHQAEIQPDYDYPDMVLDGAFASYYQHQLVGWKELQARYLSPLYEICLEKLHSSPESEMRKLAQWLGIDWHPCLLESSFNGLAYWGDRRAHQKIQGFSASHPLSADWQSCFSSLDKQVLYALLDHDLHRQGYPRAMGAVKAILPLLIYLPTRLEWQALSKALREGQPHAFNKWRRELQVRWQVCFDGLKH